MQENQKDKCAICFSDARKENSYRSVLCVDHDHKTGQIRELLCHSCNTGLGMFKDDLVFLENAKNYIIKHCELYNEKLKGVKK